MTRFHPVVPRAVVAVAAATALLAGALTGTAPVLGTAVAAPSDDLPADLVLFPGTLNEQNPLGSSNRAASLVANKETVQGLRGTFAGITLDFPTGWEAMTPGYDADVASETAKHVTPLLESGVLEGFTHNLVRAQIRPEIGWDDDAAWSRVYANFDALTQYSVATGSRGILFDIENYVDIAGDGSSFDDGPFDWREGVDGPLDETEELARERGSELVSTILDRQPTAEVVLTLGSSFCADKSDGGHYQRLELQCPFIAGALDAAIEPNQIIDGGEQYQLRSKESFERSYEWRGEGLLDEPQMDFLSDDDQTRWRKYLGLSNGLETKWKQNPDYEMTPTQYEDALYHALRTNDRLTWAYVTEDDILRPGFPDEWRRAMDDAVARANRG